MAVTVQLGGVERTLKFTFSSLRRLEGRGHFFLDADALQKTDFARAGVLGDMLWAACLHFDPTLTPEQTDEWIGPGQLGVISSAVLDAYLEYLGGEQRPRPSPSTPTADASPSSLATGPGSSTGSP